MKIIKIFATFLIIYFCVPNLFAGAIDPETGKYYPSAGDGGVIDPETGKYFPKSGDNGFIDPETGKFYPRIDNGNEKRTEKQTTNTPPSREQIINRAWKKSNAYSKFKMGSMSKIEGESSKDYNKWVKVKEEKAKHRWIERCKNGIERDCWKEPVAETKIENTDEIEHEQDETRERNVSWVDNKNKKPLKPADSGAIQKEKKNGVWKFSN